MLKFFFAGGGFAGFVLAVILGYGYNPIASSGNPSSNAEPKVQLKATLSPGKQTTGAPAAAPVPAAAVPAVSPTAIDPANLAQTLQSTAPGLTNNTGAPSGQSLTDILNGLAGSTPSASSSSGSSSSPTDMLSSLFGGNGGSQTDLLSSLLAGANGGAGQSDLLNSLMGGNNADFSSLLNNLMAGNGNNNAAGGLNLSDLMKMFGNGQQQNRGR